jgi:hypothetical protein
MAEGCPLRKYLFMEIFQAVFQIPVKNTTIECITGAVYINRPFLRVSEMLYTGLPEIKATALCTK